MCSTLSAHGAGISIRALSLGAAECILKPGGDSILTANDFQTNLISVVRSLSQGRKRHNPSAAAKQPLALRRDSALFTPKILAIGSSTGGPKALMEVLKGLNGPPVPIVITQHMPKTFTTLLAQHITQSCGLPCFEGKDGEIIKPGCAYVAPGGFHMTFKKVIAGVAIHITEDPPENFCRPSVNPMIRSLISIYGGKILAVILTGMGSDGLQVCTDLVAHGGRVIAQDEASSVVWGMPGAVAKAGLCSAVLPLSAIPDWVNQAMKGSVS